MKEALVSRGPSVELVDSDIPTPGPGQILIQVMVSGCNPKDWKMSEYYGFERFNTGDDLAGVVTAVGSDVIEFKPGDRIAAMHQPGAPHGTYAEYAIAQADTTFHIPNFISYEEAATIPLAALTAAGLLFKVLELPEPQRTGKNAIQPIPFVVYGASSAVGAFAIQLAKHRGIGLIIAVAGKGTPFVDTLLNRDQGDIIVDYRQDDKSIIADLQAALQGAKLCYALDAVRNGGALQMLLR